MIQYFNNVFGHRLKSILLLPNGLRHFCRFAMTTKVDEKQIVFFLKVSQLLMPYRRASSCAVDEDDPLAALSVYKLLEV